MTRKPKTLIKLSFIVGFGLSLAACQHTAATAPAPSEKVMRNEVKMVRLPFRIAAEDDQTDTPSSYTLNGISLFLRSVNAGHADVVMLDSTDVAPERVDAIIDHIKTAGLLYAGNSALGEKPADGEITLYVERHIVVPPNCGNWGVEISGNDVNNASAHHGCSTIANLGLMIANPRDLIAGQNGGNSTAAAVGAIYTPTPTPSGPTMTVSLDGLANLPVPSGAGAGGGDKK